MAEYRCTWLCLVILITYNSFHALALPVKPATSDQTTSELLSTLEEAPADIADSYAELDTAEGAIDRLFETYERQYLHDLRTAAKAELGHTIRLRDVAAAPEAEQHSYDDDGDAMLANVYVDRNNAQRSREQHELFSFGMGPQWTAEMTQTDRPLVVDDTDPVVRDKKIATEASVVDAVVTRTVAAVENAIVSAETTALEHIANIVGDADVPLDVPVSHSDDAPTGASDPGDRVAYVTHQMVDAAMQYDVDNRNVNKRSVRQLIDLTDDQLEPRDRRYRTPDISPFFRTNNVTYRMMNRQLRDRHRSKKQIHDDVFLNNLEAYLILFTGRSYSHNVELKEVLTTFMNRKQFMDNRYAWLISNVQEYMADVAYYGMGNSTARLPEYMLSGNQTLDQQLIDRLTFNRRWGAELRRRVDGFNAQQRRQDAARLQREMDELERRQASEAEKQRKEADLSIITIERDVNDGEVVETINAELGPNKLVVLEKDMMPNGALSDRISIVDVEWGSDKSMTTPTTTTTTTTTQAPLVELTTPNWQGDFEVDGLVPWYVMTKKEREDTEFAAYLHALIAVNEVGPLEPFYFIESRVARSALAAAGAEVDGGHSNVTIAENEHGILLRTTNGIVLEVKEVWFDTENASVATVVGSDVSSTADETIAGSVANVSISINETQTPPVEIITAQPTVPEVETPPTRTVELLQGDGLIAVDHNISKPQFTAVASSSDVPQTNIEIVAVVPAEEGFASTAAVVEPVVSRSELLHAESLLPPVAEQTPASNIAAEVNEAQVISENKLEASEQVLAPIVGAQLLEDADLGQIAPITVRKARVLEQTVDHTTYEGSGDDSAESAVVVHASAKVVDDSAESAEADDDRSKIIVLPAGGLPIAVTNQTAENRVAATLDTSAESEENDSNTAAEKHDTPTSGRSQSDDDDDKDDSNSISASDVLQTVVEAVHLGTDLNNAKQTFRDSETESASIRQARSRSAAAAAADALAASDAGLDGADHAATTAVAGARSGHPVNFVTAVAGYGSVVATLSAALVVGMWLVYRRMQDARHVLVIAQV